MGSYTESGKGRQTNMFCNVSCDSLQLQTVLDIYIPFDDESSPLDGLTGLAFSTPG